MEILIIAVFIGLIPAAIANSKGHGPFVLWWIYGAAIFIVAIIHAIVLRPKQKAIDMAQAADGFRKCPACAEMVRAEASICKHCRSDLIPATQR